MSQNKKNVNPKRKKSKMRCLNIVDLRIWERCWAKLKKNFKKTIMSCYFGQRYHPQLKIKTGSCTNEIIFYCFVIFVSFYFFFILISVYSFILRSNLNVFFSAVYSACLCQMSLKDDIRFHMWTHHVWIYNVSGQNVSMQL